MFHGTDAIWWDETTIDAVAQLDIPHPFAELAEEQAVAGLLKVGTLMGADAYEDVYERALAAQD